MLSPKGNFIEQYDDIISVDECNAIRSLFQQDHRCHVGRVGKEGRIDKSVKDSMDLTVKFDDKEEEYNIILHQPLKDAIGQYIQKYYYLNEFYQIPYVVMLKLPRSQRANWFERLQVLNTR